MNQFRKLKYKGQKTTVKPQVSDANKKASKKKEVKAVESGSEDTGENV